MSKGNRALKQIQEKLQIYPWMSFDPLMANVEIGGRKGLIIKDYLNDQSHVAVHSYREIKDWLLTCRYAGDEGQFGSSDYWMLPSEFEQKKRGDCEDHALWAWHKMKALGLHAQFVVGDLLHESFGLVGHAWLVIDRDGEPFIFDPTWKAAGMEIPWGEAQKRYFPSIGIDTQLRGYEYRNGKLISSDS